MVFFVADNIVSSLGMSTKQNFKSLLNGNTGISVVENNDIYNEPFQASMINDNVLEEHYNLISKKYPYSNIKHTRLEKMLIVSVDEALSKTNIDITSHKTGIILSTTKGNINLLEPDKRNSFATNRVSLWKLGEVIKKFFGNPNMTIVISNACISGVLAINKAAMMIQSEKYDNVVVTGADLVSRFVVSGFMSFMSLSSDPCRPFDKERNGLSLGEAASTIILSSDPNGNSIRYRGGGSANDANHISGPSRTGEGSFIAINKALIEAGITSSDIDHISSHGTATPYNDEMESVAIDRHNLNKVPVNSIKGYLGHTLGAAGLVETSILLEEMRMNTLIKSAGFENLGVSKDISVITQTQETEITTCLKMASGFGGSNASLIISKVGNDK
ncbi:MAG: beta-ketoacyl synthase [Lentimicrobiaceae bacterium]|jgi:3-oxoacyl-[acyl-carrier-protein] synthase-1|nr:beta-ketoacyl synthase [Lentimicrobiaceae bacterium]MCP4910516.1 beta-ketoacyl synthase [Bacteroidota bacterium]MBT3455370.1 beta-ketoacyl synthase [Lentimicrobiaceae bacterium]MBT3818790.1 beta-ketoacyl synthase [Lentimicrobiaceae bacterium]MBT4062057.1 beta-ketoacyl synthase [Lentimicrobiaceae bacterium]